jgi:hypothetical protein
MSKAEIPIIARKARYDLSGELGSILYISHETLTHADVYLLGFNTFHFSRSVGDGGGTSGRRSRSGSVIVSVRLSVD